MRKHFKYLTIFVAIGILVTFSNCGKDPEPTQREIVTEKLVAGGTWRTITIKADNTDIVELFDDFTLKFNANNTYQTTGTTPVWARNGTWNFTSDAATAFVKEDNNTVEIVELTDTKVILRLFWDQETYESGRSKSISGLHEFELQAQ